MDATHSLTGHLLLAMPGMTDPNFHQAVTYICEHSPSGALGIVINKPMTMDVGDVLEQLALDTEAPLLRAQPVLQNGAL
jgi:putative transcriptional regulator